jgi:hypothetical protein
VGCPVNLPDNGPNYAVGLLLLYFYFIEKYGSTDNIIQLVTSTQTPVPSSSPPSTPAAHSTVKMVVLAPLGDWGLLNEFIWRRGGVPQIAIQKPGGRGVTPPKRLPMHISQVTLLCKTALPDFKQLLGAVSVYPFSATEVL